MLSSATLVSTEAEYTPVVPVAEIQRRVQCPLYCSCTAGIGKVARPLRVGSCLTKS